MRRAYADACLLIYWVERSGPLALAATRWVLAQRDVTLCVSPLTRLEVLVNPRRSGNEVLVAAYDTVLAQQEWLPMGRWLRDKQAGDASLRPTSDH